MDTAGCDPSRKVVVFDLDDTLIDECDFTVSGIHALAPALEEAGADAEVCCRAMLMAVAARKPHFDALERMLDLQGLDTDTLMPALVHLHRSHVPERLEMRPDMSEAINRLASAGVRMGIITDGRSVTQRHKIEAVGLTTNPLWSGSLDSADILISGETGYVKTQPEPFLHFMNKYGQGSASCQFWYVGDNPAKDFIQPRRLGWHTVCMADRGRNVHPPVPGPTAGTGAEYNLKEGNELVNLIYGS